MRDPALNRAIDDLAGRFGSRLAALRVEGAFRSAPPSMAPVMDMPSADHHDTPRLLLLMAAIGAACLPVAGFWAVGQHGVEEVESPAAPSRSVDNGARAVAGDVGRAASPPAVREAPIIPPIPLPQPTRERLDRTPAPAHARPRASASATRLLNLRELRRIDRLSRERQRRDARSETAATAAADRYERDVSEDAAATRRLNLREQRRLARRSPRAH